MIPAISRMSFSALAKAIFALAGAVLGALLVRERDFVVSPRQEADDASQVTEPAAA